MLDFLDKLYVSIPRKGILLAGLKFVVRVVANYYVRFFLTSNRISEKVDSQTLIVSLTSYPARIEKLWMVLKTLLCQRGVDNYKVILWLSRKQFPQELASLPLKLVKLGGGRYSLC